MHDAFVVRRRESVTDLDRVLDRFTYRHRAATETLTECFALQQLRHDIWRAIVLADVMNRENVGMIQGRSSTRFLLEPLEALRIGGQCAGQDLDRDITA